MKLAERLADSGWVKVPVGPPMLRQPGWYLGVGVVTWIRAHVAHPLCSGCSTPQGVQVHPESLGSVLDALHVPNPILRSLLLHPQRPCLHLRIWVVTVKPHELRIVYHSETDWFL